VTSRFFKFNNIFSFSLILRLAQSDISLMVLPQPKHKLLAGLILQTFMQGDIIIKKLIFSSKANL
tara:strand:+ start:340 stop:534 length:195 start_codon:yes stop_codon:yes gene_type:complete